MDAGHDCRTTRDGQNPSHSPLSPYRDRKYFRLGAEICELDQVIARDDEWTRLPESLDPGWSIFRREGFIFASRILT